MRKIVLTILMGVGLLTGIGMQAAPAFAGTAAHHAPHATTRVAPPLPAAQTASCTQGHLDYGVGSVTISADWEPPGSCGWHVRTCSLDSTNTSRCGGFVKATELVTTSPQANGTMADGWLQQYLDSTHPQRWCWDVLGQVSTSWHKCSGKGFGPPVHTTAAGMTLQPAGHTTVDGKRVSWFHICLTHSNGSHCITANGVGRDLSLAAGSGNKWQAIPERSDGRIAWQNGSGNCMTVDGSTGGVQAAGSGCADVTSEEWFVGGSGNLTFNNVGTQNYMGTNGDAAGKLVYAHPAHTGFFRGWTTFSCCLKTTAAHTTGKAAGITLDAFTARRVPQSGHLKESFGAGYYVGTPSLNYGSGVSEEFGGRQMTFFPDGNYCAPDGNCYTRGVLDFTSGANNCAQASGTSVLVAECSGVPGIEWAEKIVSGHIHFINDNESSAAGADIFMGGLQCGCPLTMGRAGVPSGVLQAWDFL